MTTNQTTDNKGVRVLMLGDIHGDPSALQKAFSKARWSDCVAIVQCGDFGYGWSIGADDKCDFSMLASEMSQETGIPLYWVDGNHENFDHLLQQPLDENGLRPIADGVTHLPRGSTLTIDGVRFRAFGGAYSVDIDYREPHVSWWPQETITDDDVAVALAAGPADVFISHDAPTGVQDTEGLRRKLADWGKDAAQKSIENQNRVREALLASGAMRAYHGHLHQSYDCFLDHAEGWIKVTGLNRDNQMNNFEVATF